MASHQQANNVDKEEATELFDELLSDFEEDEEEDIVDTRWYCRLAFY